MYFIQQRFNNEKENDAKLEDTVLILDRAYFETHIFNELLFQSKLISRDNYDLVEANL
jgi:deoxyadenosine/deoxycytidine kinase